MGQSKQKKNPNKREKKVTDGPSKVRSFSTYKDLKSTWTVALALQSRCSHSRVALSLKECQDGAQEWHRRVCIPTLTTCRQDIDVEQSQQMLMQMRSRMNTLSEQAARQDFLRRG